MTNLQRLLRSEDTPMDAAERAAIAKLIELDKNNKTEFYEDDPVGDLINFANKKEDVYGNL